MRIPLLALLLMLPTLSQAAGWCLVLDERESCRFSTAEDCYKTARFQGGSCRPNYKSVGVISDRGDWCVITADSKNCSYNVRQQCLYAARRINGGCVENVEKSLAEEAAGIEASQAGTCDLDCQLKEASLAAGGATTEQMQVDGLGDSDLGAGSATEGLGSDKLE